MEILFEYISNEINLFFLIFIRISGMFTYLPIFGRKDLPNIFKLLMALSFSYLIFPFFDSQVINQMDQNMFILFIVKEFTLGILIGIAGELIFSAFFIAGSFIDAQLGFSMANVLDPMYGQRVAITGNFIYIIGILVMLSIDGHHYIIRAIVNSFQVFPVEKLINLNSNLLSFTLQMIRFIFETSVQIAMPVIIAIFLTNLVLGVMAKTMPQMNVFVIGMPLKIIIGLAVLVLSIPMLEPIYKNVFLEFYEFVYKILRIL